MSELRKDPFSDRWVIICRDRLQRPNEFISSVVKSRAVHCPFCAGHEAETPPAIATYCLNGDGNWQARVVPNKYPAIRQKGRPLCTRVGPYQSQTGTGVHEVIIESPRHLVSLSQLPIDQAQLTFRIYRDRLQSLKQSPALAYALIFKNVGPAAGASLEHLHSQIIATTLVPAAVTQEMDAAHQAYRASGRCLFCEIVDREIHDSERLVAITDKVVAFCPFASRFPYEVWVLPRHHASHFEHSPLAVLDELSLVVREVIAAYEKTLPEPSYNYLLHTSPFDSSPLNHYHWHVEIFPRVTHAAGFEWGTGYYINPMPPEEAASSLRQLIRPETQQLEDNLAGKTS